MKYGGIASQKVVYSLIFSFHFYFYFKPHQVKDGTLLEEVGSQVTNLAAKVIQGGTGAP